MSMDETTTDRAVIRAAADDDEDRNTRHAGWARTLDETATLRAEVERLTQELALVNDTLVQRTKAMHRALDKAEAAASDATEYEADLQAARSRLTMPRHCRACGHDVTVQS